MDEETPSAFSDSFKEFSRKAKKITNVTYITYR